MIPSSYLVISFPTWRTSSDIYSWIASFALVINFGYYVSWKQVSYFFISEGMFAGKTLDKKDIFIFSCNILKDVVFVYTFRVIEQSRTIYPVPLKVMCFFFSFDKWSGFVSFHCLFFFQKFIMNWKIWLFFCIFSYLSQSFLNQCVVNFHTLMHLINGGKLRSTFFRYCLFPFFPALSWA